MKTKEQRDSSTCCKLQDLVCWGLGTGAFCPSLVLQPRPPVAAGAQEHRPFEGHEHPVVDKRWVEQDPGQHSVFTVR